MKNFFEESNREAQHLNPNANKSKWPRKAYSSCESCVHCCVNIPCSCGLDREFRNEVIEGKYVVSDPTIAYRADKRPPKMIFADGFSAYSAYRAVNKLFPPMDTACDTLDLECLAKNAFLFPCHIVLSGIVLLNCIARLISSPCTVFGQNVYDAPFVSNWSALALSTNYSSARYLQATTNEYWRYIVLLDGYISYSDFSIDLIETNKEKDPRSNLWGGVFDAKEIFPKNLDDQTISPLCIVGAIKIENDRESEYFIFNKNFEQWDKIKSALEDNNCHFSNDEIPEAKISFEMLEPLLKNELLEMNDEATATLGI